MNYIFTQKYDIVGAILSTSVVGPIMLLSFVLLCYGFRSPLSTLFCFIVVFVFSLVACDVSLMR